MRGPGPWEVAVVATAITAATVLALADRETAITWAFMCLMLSALSLVALALVDSARRAAAEHRRAEVLGATEPSQAARRAVAQERQRLGQDLDRCVREALERVAEETARVLDGADQDLGGVVRRIHEHTREATSELRRQLGLMREDESTDFVAPPLPKQDLPLGISRRDVLLGVGAGLLGVLEAYSWLPRELPEAYSPWCMVTTGLAGLSLVGASAVPHRAALLCAVLVAGASVVGAMVSSGLWMVLTTGVFLWRLAGGWRAVSLVVGLLLAGAVAWSRWLDDRANLEFIAVTMLVAFVIGGSVGHTRRVRESAIARAGQHEEVIVAASREAVHAERTTMARDLHDVVSHAVGVIAMQAAAAEVSWPDRPGVARDAVKAIDHTARTALSELDRVLPGTPPPQRTIADVIALIERIRTTGTSVDLATNLEAHDAVSETEFRIVQEGLTNVVRHAPGTRVLVTIQSDEESTTVRLVDDGPGAAEKSRRGYGLIGLAERVAFADGRLVTGCGMNGRGFSVTATLPSRTRRDLS